jgi:hypothetical protein
LTALQTFVELCLQHMGAYHIEKIIYSFSN